MRKSIIFTLCVSLVCFLILGSRVSETHKKTKKLPLRVNVMNDKPGTVEIHVQGTDARKKVIVNEVMTWDDNNNIFSTETLEIHAKTCVCRFTFINESYDGTGNPDSDRNAVIDYFTLNHNRYAAEDFNRTGGTDYSFLQLFKSFHIFR